MPISSDDQLHHEQDRMNGPPAASPEGASEGSSSVFTVNGEVQIGQL
jgi:hypothetical protein